MLELISGAYDEAIELARTALDHNPEFGPAHRLLSAALALDGRLDEAKAAWKTALQVQPLEMPNYVASIHRVLKQERDAERFLEGLKLAGAKAK